MKRIKILLTAVTIALPIINVHAQSLPVTPGLWESTTTITSNMMDSQTRTNQECMTDKEIDPRKMMEGLPAEQCDLKSNVSGKTMKFTMDCSTDGGTMQGEGQFTVDGETATGVMNVKGNMAGMALEMEVKSSGKRVGDC